MVSRAPAAEHLRQVLHLAEVEQVGRGGRTSYRERAKRGQPRGERLAACLWPDTGPEPDEHRAGRRDHGLRPQQVMQAAGGQRGAGAQAERIAQGGEHGGPDDGHRAAPLVQ
jgi:hypothetical protein